MELSAAAFDELAKVIHHLTGLVIAGDKAYLVRHRLEPVAKIFDCASFEEFIAALKSARGPRIHDALIEAITTNETSFFRDPWLFDALLQRVLPECAARLKGSGAKRHRIRIWSAAASTGQEAYSLAMLVRELIDAPGCEITPHQFSILASDISPDVLKTARAGLYAAADLQRGVTESRQRQHFQRSGQQWQVKDDVRSIVQFRRLDLLRPPADLGAFDLVLCRNVLIYFDQESRQQVCDAIYKLLMDGGYLVLGSAESLYGMEHRFETVKYGRAVLYRKLRAT